MTFYNLILATLFGVSLIKTLHRQQLAEMAQHPALFFSHDGILVDNATGTPFIAFSAGAQYVDIQRSVLDNGTLIIQGHVRTGAPFRICPAKTFLAEAEPTIHSTLLRAAHWVNWDQRTTHCSQCGGQLDQNPHSTEKQCMQCQSLFFPNLAPAIMVLIERENKILLARSPHFRPTIYSALAGFVDVGESAEDAVHREVFEEVGLAICDLRYFGSQSWPFPGSFMIAFHAQYAGGELTLDPTEIEDARWFTKHDLPALPDPASIAYRLIHSVLQN